MNDVPCCAHLNIVFAPVTVDGRNIRGELVPGGAQYAKWECRDCKTEFVPKPLAEHRARLIRQQEGI